MVFDFKNYLQKKGSNNVQGNVFFFSLGYKKKKRTQMTKRKE